MNAKNTTEGLFPFMPTPASWAKTTAFVLLGVAFLVGCPGNIVLLMLFLKQVKTTTKWVIITIASTDLVYFLVHAPTYVIYKHPNLFFHIRGSVFCKLYYFVFFSLSTCLTILFDFLAVDRFVKISHPHSRMLIEERSKYICRGKVLVSPFFAIPHLIVNHRVSLTRCTLPNNTLTTTLTTFRYILSACSLIHLSLLYIKIVCTIQRRRQGILNLTNMARAKGIPDVKKPSDNPSKVRSNVNSESEVHMKVNAQVEISLEDSCSETASKSDVIFTISRRENATKKRDFPSRRTDSTTKIICVTIFLFILSYVLPSLLAFTYLNVFD